MTLRMMFLPLIALMTLTACETIKGAGRDLEGAGEAITDQAQETKTQM
ncbi:MAG: entericidin A/B family lipoprotein [Pseudomonadota bacterium]